MVAEIAAVRSTLEGFSYDFLFLEKREEPS
jgi:hypothetical protein